MLLSKNVIQSRITDKSLDILEQICHIARLVPRKYPSGKDEIADALNYSHGTIQNFLFCEELKTTTKCKRFVSVREKLLLRYWLCVH